MLVDEVTEALENATTYVDDVRRSVAVAAGLLIANGLHADEAADVFNRLDAIKADLQAMAGAI